MIIKLTNPNILAVDALISGPWFQIVVVTKTEVLAATMKAKRHTDVLRMLESEFDPYETLRSNSPLEHPVKMAPLSDIRALEWSDGYFGQKYLKTPSRLIIHYFDHEKEKLKRFKARFNTLDTFDYIVQTIKPLIGQWEEKQAPSTIWRTGIPAFVSVLFVFAIFSLRAVYRFFMYGPKISEITENFDSYFLPVLRFSFGRDIPFIIFMLTLALLWWFISCFNPPTRTILRPIRSNT